jgi:division protein CdvB (Snf7/Vps24/ESCRT-III family)
LAKTPVSAIVATIEEVQRIQGQLIRLAEAVERLTQRLDVMETQIQGAAKTDTPG